MPLLNPPQCWTALRAAFQRVYGHEPELPTNRRDVAACHWLVYVMTRLRRPPAWAAAFNDFVWHPTIGPCSPSLTFLMYSPKDDAPMKIVENWGIDHLYVLLQRSDIKDIRIFMKQLSSFLFKPATMPCNLACVLKNPDIWG